MHKQKFLDELRRHLSQLPEAEIQKHLSYYDEMIADRVEDGMSEEAAVSSLEDVSVIAERIMQDVSLPTLVKTKVRPEKGWSTAAVVLAIVLSPLWIVLAALLFTLVVLAFTLLFTVAIVIVCFVVVFLAVGVFLLISPIIVTYSTIAAALAFVSAGFALVGLGLLSVLLGRVVFHGISQASVSIVRSVKSIFIRRAA